MSEKTYNISKCSARKSAYDGDRLRPVCKFLESSNSKRKKSYAQISDFFEFLLNLVKLWSKCGQTPYSRNISVTK